MPSTPMVLPAIIDAAKTRPPARVGRQGCNRRDADSAACWADGRDDGYADADNEGGDDGPQPENKRTRGSVIPKPFSRSSSRWPSAPEPETHERRDEPRMAASRSRTEQLATLAPRILSSASSRVRWPTRIENVLKIVNPPTNSEMKAKTSNAVEKNERAWLTS